MTLKSILDRLYEARSYAHLANDPVSFCHRYSSPEDREVVGLIASCFAYGNVRIILRNLEQIFTRLGPSPRKFAEAYDPEEGRAVFSGFRHRFNDARDLSALLLAIRTMISRAGSIERFFARFHNPEAPDVSASLSGFSEAVLAMDYSAVFGGETIPADSYFPFLFPSPTGGSACKRLCMFLRWMVRPEDGIDLGLWHEVAPAQLVIPVDAHIRRIAGYLGLTARNQADWRMAVEITAKLKELDPDDPVKYDFSLCHIGISEGCNGRDLRCGSCVLETICSLAGAL